MPNQKLALEWVVFARKNLETAQLLFSKNHYTDVIAFDIQQAIEKALKAVYHITTRKYQKYTLLMYCTIMRRRAYTSTISISNSFLR